MRELTSLDPKKPAGSDDLAASFNKIGPPHIATPLTDIFNLSLQMTDIPTIWKEATVLPLFKGGNQADPNSYRPISILLCVYKVIEKIVNKQLTGYMDMYGTLSGLQSGFRSGHSCVTSTLKVLKDITSALDAKQHCAAIFINLAKAFDAVDHSILLHRLSSIMVSNDSLSWFSHYLSHRVQRVKFESFLSHSLPVFKGVP